MLTWMPLFMPNSAEWEFICDFISRVALPQSLRHEPSTPDGVKWRRSVRMIAVAGSSLGVLD